jgi:hypothetical protein
MTLQEKKILQLMEEEHITRQEAENIRRSEVWGYVNDLLDKHEIPGTVNCCSQWCNIEQKPLLGPGFVVTPCCMKPMHIRCFFMWCSRPSDNGRWEFDYHQPCPSSSCQIKPFEVFGELEQKSGSKNTSKGKGKALDIPDGNIPPTLPPARDAQPLLPLLPLPPAHNTSPKAKRKIREVPPKEKRNIRKMPLEKKTHNGPNFDKVNDGGDGHDIDNNGGPSQKIIPPDDNNNHDKDNDSSDDDGPSQKTKKTMAPDERLQRGLEEAFNQIPDEIMLDPEHFKPTYNQHGDCTNVAQIHLAIEGLQRVLGVGKALHILAYRNVGNILRNRVASQGQNWTNSSKIDAQRWYETQSGKANGALKSFFFTVEQVYEFCNPLNDNQILGIRTTTVEDIRRANKAEFRDIWNRVLAAQAIGDEDMDAIRPSKRISRPSRKLREA